MSLTEKKEVLLEIIEDADEKLAGLLIALANEYNEPHNTFSKGELDFFEERRNSFFATNKKGSTVEEVHNKARRNYHNGL